MALIVTIYHAPNCLCAQNLNLKCYSKWVVNLIYVIVLILCFACFVGQATIRCWVVCSLLTPPTIIFTLARGMEQSSKFWVLLHYTVCHQLMHHRYVELHSLPWSVLPIFRCLPEFRFYGLPAKNSGFSAVHSICLFFCTFWWLVCQDRTIIKRDRCPW